MLAVLSAIVFAAGSIGIYTTVTEDQQVAAADQGTVVTQVEVKAQDQNPMPGDLGW